MRNIALQHACVLAVLCLLWSSGALRAEPVVQGSIDLSTLSVGQLAGQHGWLATGQSGTVETTVKQPGDTNVLEFDFPYANCSHALPTVPSSGKFDIDVTIGFPPVADATKGKAQFFLVQLVDAKGKPVAQLARVANGDWNARNGAAYSEVPGPSPSGEWVTLRFELDPKAGTYGGVLIDNGKTIPIFTGLALVDSSAGTAASINFSRTGGGPPDTVYVDAVRVLF